MTIDSPSQGFGSSLSGTWSATTTLAQSQMGMAQSSGNP
jgi:hypothetical protein